MINIPIFEDFINEDMLYTKDKKPLFNSMEPMSPANFLKAIKGTPEGNETNTNFGKGIEAVKYLSKNLKVPLDVYVYLLMQTDLSNTLQVIQRVSLNIHSVIISTV
jgi:hypothetical protein